jgi:NADH-quinone oxidoreductase subunit N
VLTSVLGAYYYLRVVVVMYMREPVGEDDWSPASPAAAFALAVCAAFTLVLGVWPATLLTLARLAARSLL